MIGASASSVGDSDACVTDTRHFCALVHRMLFAPNGPLLTFSTACTAPLASDVVMRIAGRLQSPEPVLVPLSAHWITVNASFGVNPLPVTFTCTNAGRLLDGSTVIVGCADDEPVAEPVAPLRTELTAELAAEPAWLATELTAELARLATELAADSAAERTAVLPLLEHPARPPTATRRAIAPIHIRLGCICILLARFPGRRGDSLVCDDRARLGHQAGANVLARDGPRSPPGLHPGADPRQGRPQQAEAMTFTDWLVDIALVLIVVRQLRVSRYDWRAVLIPLAIAAFVAKYYLRGVPTGGSDLLLLVTLTVIGVVFGVASAAVTRVWSDGGRYALVQAGAAAAALWVLGMGSRLAFAVWASHGGAPTLVRFSEQHHLSLSAWTAALVFMALAEVLSRIAILAWRGRVAANAGTPAVTEPVTV